MLNRSFAAVAMSLAVAGTMPGLASPVPQLVASQSKGERRRILAAFAGKSLIGTRLSRRTVAMDKRAAAKRRNQARNRASARG